jgi:hypothetical protein
MSKKIITLLMAMAFTVGVTSVSIAAKTATCKVTAVDGNTVTLDCTKNADALKVGAKVKVKSAKRRAVEGC